MSQVTQKEAVFNAVSAVLQQNGIAIEPGTNVVDLMTRELRAQVNQRLFDAFQSGTVKLDREYSDTELKAYVSGLQSNWLRKDTRFNGNGDTSAPKKVSDPQLKALYGLMKIAVGDEDRIEIQSHIDARLAQISTL